ncbi:hypothetical protein ACM9XC_05540 [Xanthomonas sacchari]
MKMLLELSSDSQNGILQQFHQKAIFHGALNGCVKKAESMIIVGLVMENPRFQEAGSIHGVLIQAFTSMFLVVMGGHLWLKALKMVE